MMHRSSILATLLRGPLAMAGMRHLALAAMLLGLASNAAAQPTGFTLSVNPATVTESADATTITITATLVGGTFAEDRGVLFSSTATGSTATEVTDYTRVTTTTLTILAGQPSGTETFAFTAVADTVAEPAGETVVIGAGVLLGSGFPDTSIPTTTATITINDPPDTSVPTFSGATISPQRYVTGKMITPLTLPAATGGDGPIVYSILSTNGTTITDLSTVIPGLTLDTVARTITGAPTTLATQRGYSWAAHDSDTNMASGDRATLGFNITVHANLVPAFFSGARIADQSYIMGSPITTLTLPLATGGNAPLTYTLTPAIPGVTLNPTSRVLTGTPTAAATSATYTYTANDADDDTVTLTFNAVVAADSAPDFPAGASIADQTFTIGDTVALTLPGITGGTGNISIAYTLTPALPAGLTFNPANSVRTITGSPTAAAATAEYTLTVTDGDGNTAVGDTDMLTFSITVMSPDTAPAFAAGASIPAQTFIQRARITPLTLPLATGGNGAITYALNPLPGGLTFDPTSRVLSGRPTTLTAATDLTYTAGDSDGSAAGTDQVTLMFSITVEVNIAPAFPEGVFIPNRLYLTGEVVARSLPLVTPGTGNIRIVYSLEPALPAGLTFDTSPPAIRGTLTTASFLTTTYTYTVRDTDVITSAIDSDSLEFTITVEADTAPVFAAGEMIRTQTYTQGTAITPLTLPQANGGNSYLTYTLTPAISGLTLHPTTRVLSGTPTAAVSATPLQINYVVRDQDNNTAIGDSDSLAFAIILIELDTPPTFAQGVANQVYLTGEVVNLSLPVVTGGTGNMAITYTLTPALPAGLTFNPDLRPRAIRGTLTTAAFPTTIYTYTATDTDSNTAPSDSDSLVFSITVEAAEDAPAFAAGTMIPTQTYTQYTRITPLTFPQATGGNGPLTYTLTSMGSMLPRGLTFNAAARPPTLTGVPTSFGVHDLVYTVTDADSNTATGDTATLAFRITLVEVDTAPTFADDVSIADQTYLTGEVVELTLPLVTGGTGNTALIYSLVPALPAGLTFDDNLRPRAIRGTLTTAVFPTTTYTYTAADTDANTAASDSNSLTFTITVEADTAPVFAAGEMIRTQTYTQGTAITPLTLPQANGGNSYLTYTLTPAISGLTLHPITRVLSGTPTAAVSATPLQINYMVRDEDSNTATGDSDSLAFAIILIELDTAPAFADGAADKFYFTGEVVAQTLPINIPGNGNTRIDYSLEPALPAGLTFNANNRPPTLRGTLTTGFPTTTYTYTSTDRDTNTEASDSDSLEFTITVEVDTAPAFADGTMIPPQTYPQHMMITPLTFPQANGGNGPLTYTLTSTGRLPGGLTFNDAARPPTLTGVPIDLGEYDLIYTVTDADSNTATGDTATLAFSITLTEVDTAPAFAADVADQIYLTGEEVVLTLPVVSPGTGNIGIVYTLDPPALPAGLSFYSERRPRVIAGTATTVFPTRTYTYTAADRDTNTATSDSNLLEFTITVESDTAPAFADGEMIPNQTYTPGMAMTPLTLPQATGGNGPLTYTLTGTTSMLDAGLTFDPATRVLSGVPTAFGRNDFIYRVTDADNNTATGDTATLAFAIIRVKPDITPDFAEGVAIADRVYVTSEVVAQTLPLVTGGTGNGTIVYSLVPALPAGLTFNADNRPPTLRGTLTTGVFPITTYTYTAADTDANTEASDSDSLEFTITVEVNSIPTFGGAAVGLQVYKPGTAITPLTLPRALGGNGPLTYTLTRPGSMLPTGLTFNPVTRILSGTPTGRLSTTDDAFRFFNYAVTDADGKDLGDSHIISFAIILEEVDTAPAFADGVADQLYLIGDAVDLTLPLVTGGTGNSDIIYTLTSPAGILPPGLTFFASHRPQGIAGTTTAAFPTRSYTYTATDTDDNTEPSDSDSLMFTITVAADDTAPAFATGAMISDQTYTQHTMITPLTFPQATGGNGPLTYTLTSPGSGPRSRVPQGLTFNDAARPPTLTGVSFDHGEYDIIYTVTDADSNTATGDTATLTFKIILTEVDTAPTFAEDVADQIYLTGEVVVLTLPLVSSGTGNIGIDYSLAPPALPAGLTFYPGRRPRVIAGTLTTAVFPTRTYTYTAEDRDTNVAASDSNLLEFTITVEADTAPAFTAGAMIPEQTYTPGTAMTPLTLPQATGGNGPLTYTLTSPGSMLPRGLTFNDAASPPTLTGVPTDLGEYDFIYRVTDADSNTATDDTATLTFRITLIEVDTAPTFAADVSIADQLYLTGEVVALTLPVVTDGTGNTDIFYLLEPALPAGLTFYHGLRPRFIGGTPTAAFPTTTYTYTATDEDGNTAPSDSDSRAFTITVEADTAPAFTAGAMIPEQTYTQHTMITPLTFPQTTGGNGPLTYTLTSPDGMLPRGLTFNDAASPPTLTGVPTDFGVYDFTYTVTDADSNMATEDTATLTFRITLTEVDTAPTFAAGVSIADKFYLTDEEVALTLPLTTHGTGNVAVVYSLTPGPARRPDLQRHQPPADHRQDDQHRRLPDHDLHLHGQRHRHQHRVERHQLADLQHHGGDGHRPGLHLRRYVTYRRPDLHARHDNYAAVPAASHRRQRPPHLHPDPGPARRPDL